MTPNMTEAKTGRLDETSLHAMAKKSGEIWTVLLPAAHPGAGEGKRLAMLGTLGRSLGEKNGSDRTGKIEHFLTEMHLTGGGPGLAVFAGDDSIEAHQADVAEPKIVKGSNCYLLPLVRGAQTRHEFLVLGLSKKEVRLMRHSGAESGVATTVPIELPEGMPTGLEEFHAREERDRNAQNHSSGGVRFGTRSEREEEHLHLERFFTVVDKEAGKIANGTKVLLMGVQEELALFRKVSKNLALMDGQIASGLRDVAVSEITQLGGAFVKEEQTAREAAAAQRIREWPDRSKVDGNLKRIVVAAKNGQVDTLCVQEHTAKDEALINEAVVETLSHKGEVYLVCAAEMKDLGEATALLRF